MSSKNGAVEITQKNKENKTKRRRRIHERVASCRSGIRHRELPGSFSERNTSFNFDSVPIGENENKRKPIRLVSSLGEGKLLDRFQNAINEKETKKNLRERGEKNRKTSKEKREREMAKFKAELDALLEDDVPVVLPAIKSKQNKVYVPKLSGTVKGKFEALEQKKKEEEKNKISNEKQRRIDRDFIEKKRIQIEIAQKKQQGLLNDEKDEKRFAALIKQKKKPGKLINNFEDQDKQRIERDKRKIEKEKKQKLSAELEAVKDHYSMHQDDEEDTEEGVKVSKQIQLPSRKLKKNFDDFLKEKREKERQEAKNFRKQQLEEERMQMRAAKLAAKLSESLDGESECSSSENGSSKQLNARPKRLSTSFTKFDIFERERIEEERKRIQEKRKLLLEEEKKLFEEAKLQQEKEEENEKEYSAESHQKKLPGALKSSLVNFDALARQRLQDERNRLQEERAKLLEEEKKHFCNQKLHDQISKESGSDNEEDSDDESESEKSDDFKINTSKKKRKILRTPSKLARSRLKFDVLERERMENKRLDIQKQRQALLDEEKKLFEQAKQQKERESSDSDSDKKDETAITPGRLDSNRIKFDFFTLQKMDEERERIKNERNRLLEEEKKLMDEERKKIQTSTESTDEEADIDEQENNKPKKLSSQLTKFDILERERIENERLQTKKEKIKELEEELQLFQEQKQMMGQGSSDDDITSNTRELLKLSKNAPRPKRLSASLTLFDIMERKRREEERELLQKKKALQLAEERKNFDSNWQQLDITKNNDSITKPDNDDENSKPVKRMNVQEKMEAVLKAQEEAERKRIEETKFTRMTVEQQEIYLAKQRQIEFLKEQLAKVEITSSDDEESYDDSEYTDDDDNYYYRYSNEEESKEENNSSENSNGKEEDEDDDDDDDDDFRYIDASTLHATWAMTKKFQFDNDVQDRRSLLLQQLSQDFEDTSMCSSSTNSSGSYSGAPYFVQTLKNSTVTEGDPVRFDANINANPHPKVMWYFKNRLIRNSPDYQHVIKGTQYSLYMNESFLDDVGEYMCKAVNEKGTATSKAYLFVKEAEE